MATTKPQKGNKKSSDVALQKKVSLLWPVPEGMKSAAFKFEFVIGKDGLITPGSTLTRIKGRWNNEGAKVRSMQDIDPNTYVAFASRFTAGIWATNLAKRIPAGQYRIHFVVSAVGGGAELIKEEKRLNCKCVQIERSMKVTKNGVSKRQTVVIDKDYVDSLIEKHGSDNENVKAFVNMYRKFRAGAKFCAGAFTQMLPFPSNSRITVE